MKLLIWDFDGTLGYRDGGAWTASLLEVLKREIPSHAATLEDLKPFTASGFRWQTPERVHVPMVAADPASADAWWDELVPLFQRAYVAVGLPDDDAWRLARQFRSTYLDPARWRRFDDVIPVLHSLEARGWTHVILSNHVPELPDLVRIVGLEPYFARVFNSVEIGYEKPHPRAFESVLAAFPGAKKRWMIGDSYHADVLGAEAVGIPAVLVRSRMPERIPTARTGVLYAVPNLNELPTVLAEQ